MPDNWLIVLTADPLALPSAERPAAALDLLRALRPGADEIELHVSETPEFFDCGGNFEAMRCPFCAADALDRWPKPMDRWWEGDRRSLAVETPCCGRPTSLDALDYDWPQGFACVAIELMNPGPGLGPAEQEQVEAALGLAVRFTWRHI